MRLDDAHISAFRALAENAIIVGGGTPKETGRYIERSMMDL